VEERNLNRQNFFAEDVGFLKSEALAKRLSRKFSRPVGFSIMPVGLTSISQFTLVISCVDNGPAKKDISNIFNDVNYGLPGWRIETGNGGNFGQVLIGKLFQ